LLAVPAKPENFGGCAEQLPTTNYCLNYISQALNITLGQASDLIGRWLDAKPRIFAPPFDRQLLAKMTTGIPEDATLYRNCKVDSSSFNTKLVRYSLEYWDGIWKIADSQVMSQ
jgi:hypothetical protein